MATYLLIDGNSIGHAANNGKVLTIGDLQTQAIYNFARTIHRLCALYGGIAKPIVLWDGASWRKMAFNEYKENRDRAETVHERRQLAAKDEYKKQTPYIEKLVEILGIDQMRAANMEADDLAGILTDRFTARGDKLVLVTADKDWIQLVGKGVLWFDPINDRKVRADNFEEFTGVKTPAQFVELKALMGDSGDNIPGVGGIGDKGAVAFFQAFGSWANFSNMALDGTLDLTVLDARFRKAIGKLAEDEDKRIAFARNIMLMDLRTTQRPAPINLNVRKGQADIERLRKLCNTLQFRSITAHLENWVEVFPQFQQARQAA